MIGHIKVISCDIALRNLVNYTTIMCTMKTKISNYNMVCKSFQLQYDILKLFIAVKHVNSANSNNEVKSYTF